MTGFRKCLSFKIFFNFRHHIIKSNKTYHFHLQCMSEGNDYLMFAKMNLFLRWYLDTNSDRLYNKNLGSSLMIFNFSVRLEPHKAKHMQQYSILSCTWFCHYLVSRRIWKVHCQLNIFLPKRSGMVVKPSVELSIYLMFHNRLHVCHWL